MTQVFDRQRRRIAVIPAAVLFGLSLGLAAQPSMAAPAANGWSVAGQNLRNTRSQSDQTALNVNNAGRLALKWSRTVHGDVSATPAVVDGAVYFPDWGGYLTKLDAATGKLIWERRIDSYAGEPPSAVSRTSPAVVGNTVYIGDQNGAHVLAIDAASGNLLWSTAINSHPYAIVTQSPIVHAGVVYVGASSTEEAAAADVPNYPCCSFRGSFSALDAKTGRIKWTTYTVPQNNGAPGGYSGGAVWGSTAAIDVPGKTVFITTGNNYSVPQSANQCQVAGGSMAQCLSPDDHVDSVLALDMATGRIKWSTGVQGFDTWNIACNQPGTNAQNCPPSPGPDFDFGAGPTLLTVHDRPGKPQLLVGAGQKSGVYWLLDAQTGAIRSSTVVGPGSALGGIEWGTATDGKRIYVANADYDRVPYTVNGKSVTVGSFAAIDPATGKILWQVADPSGNALTIAPVSVSNGVAFVSSMSGHMYALNAATGDVLWDYVGQGSSAAGPAIDERGTVYWGNGYAKLGALGTKSYTFYAFSIDGK
ncbi:MULTISPECIES: PQQ-binding-like beta-propeller repeat protein [Burkholderia]|uniref:Bll5504 putative polyvinyl-alcohol dehydrogenase n=1 Tax=Burkholderia singularis TaxID=1503053 RepID=A0A238H4U9_9BURK|nr:MULTISPECIES: PQQ-binding-like beta-propeller repeat protein [Burkholderia]AOK28066.1 hypothetical protein AQ611_00105 [Burkholderia sp. Bp7605]SMG00284.1 bll5504; putative polyvinyl-alcohol dehydrogenase [Burkholderia singularis]